MDNRDDRRKYNSFSTINVDGKAVNIGEMSYEDLLSLRNELSEKLNTIKSQMDDSKNFASLIQRHANIGNALLVVESTIAEFDISDIEARSITKVSSMIEESGRANEEGKIVLGYFTEALQRLSNAYSTEKNFYLAFLGACLAVESAELRKQQAMPKAKQTEENKIASEKTLNTIESAEKDAKSYMTACVEDYRKEVEQALNQSKEKGLTKNSKAQGLLGKLLDFFSGKRKYEHLLNYIRSTTEIMKKLATEREQYVDSRISNDVWGENKESKGRVETIIDYTKSIPKMYSISAINMNSKVGAVEALTNMNDTLTRIVLSFVSQGKDSKEPKEDAAKGTEKPRAEQPKELPEGGDGRE